MNSSNFRRVGAVVGVVVATITSTTPATATVDKGSKDRPCFMIRAPWNDADGPLPTCPNGRFREVASKESDAAQRDCLSNGVSGGFH